MNVGQILETHLGWAAAQGWYDDGTEASKAAKAGNGKRGKVYIGDARLRRRDASRTSTTRSSKWQDEHKGRIRMDVDKSRRAGHRRPRASSRSSTAAPASRSRSR